MLRLSALLVIPWLALLPAATVAAAAPTAIVTIADITPSRLVANTPMTVRYQVTAGDGTPVTNGTVLMAMYINGSIYSRSCGAPSGTCTFTTPTAGLYELAVVFSGPGYETSWSALVGVRTYGQPRYSFAEGATGPFFDTYLLLANAADVGAPIRLRFVLDEGPPMEQTLTVPPASRLTLKLDEFPGLESARFGIEVVSLSGLSLGVERAMYFAHDTQGPRAGHASPAWLTGAPAPSAPPVPITPGTFVFPPDPLQLTEGSNQAPFRTYLLLASYEPSSSIVLTYMPDGAPSFTSEVRVSSYSRVTIDTSTIPALAGRAFAVRVPNDGIVVERAQYLVSDADDTLVGGHTGRIQSTLTDHAYLAEGATSGAFSTFLLLSNPRTFATDAVVTYHTAAHETVTRTHTVQEMSRLTIDVEAEDVRLRDTTFWIEVDGRVGVERSMYWSTPGATSWTEGHASAALPARTSMIFAEGVTGGAWDTRTFLLLANPGVEPAVVSVRYLLAEGPPVERQYVVQAGDRLTIAVHDDAALAWAEFGMSITSTVPIVAERSVYWTLGEPGFVGGTCGGPQPY